MTKIRSILCTFVLSAVAFTACNFQQAKDVTRAVLGAADIACILNKLELGNDAIAQACGIKDEAKPAIDALVREHKAAMARSARAGTCK